MATQGMTQFPGGFANGLSVRGMPLVQTQTGKVFWVLKSGAANQVGQKDGSDGNRGTYDAPFATIAGALGMCTAGRGDTIFVKAGHTEAIADATTLALNVKGVAIIGLGTGSSRPTLTFGTATTANIPITAADMAIQNILFVCNFAAVVSVFTATSTNTPTDFSVERCEFRDTSSVKNFISIVTGNATANSLDGLRFVGNRISSLGISTATTALKIASDTDRVTIQDNYGNWAVLNNTAAMLAAGSAQVTNLDFGRNILQRPNTSSTGGSFVSGSGNAWTGHCYDNYMYQVDASSGIWIATGHGTALGFSQNFSPISGAADASGLINPAAA
jgi:hypothetical protein